MEDSCTFKSPRYQMKREKIETNELFIASYDDPL
jgi:hypothetical protein